MIPDTHTGRMYHILRRREELDFIAQSLPGFERPLFGPVSVPMPRLSPPELGFIRAVAWLYVIYFEVGRLGISFLIDRFEVYSHDSDGAGKAHRKTVQVLRTFLQHNMDPLNKRNRSIQEGAGKWFRSKCATALPTDDEQWDICVGGILSEAAAFFDLLLQTLKRIETDDSLVLVVENWNLRRSRHLTDETLDQLISIAARDMGRTEVDAARVRKVNRERWAKHLNLLSGGADVMLEARKLIEYVLLTDTASRLPISGLDILSEFGVAPGSEVERILQVARNYFERNPCSKYELIAHLRKESAV